MRPIESKESHGTFNKGFPRTLPTDNLYQSNMLQGHNKLQILFEFFSINKKD